MNAELKEGDTVSMNCNDVESACYARRGPTCYTIWRAHHTVSQANVSLCKRYKDLGGTDCQIPHGPYKSKTSYQGSGVVHITDLRREERGIYKCECHCGGGNIVNFKYYYGVIIVCK